MGSLTIGLSRLFRGPVRAMLGCALTGILCLLFGGGAAWAESFSAPQCRADFVLVKKAERKLYLMRGGRVVRDYRIALGPNPSGHKQRQGDKRTPEGRYVLDWRNPASRFYKSIHISYPSPSDRRAARNKGVHPGGMIMIHGVPDNGADWPVWLYEQIDWTDGCIAVKNAAMDEIWASVAAGTPIEISP